MQESEKRYLFFIFLHVVIGVAIYYFPSLSRVYGALIILASIFYVINSQNKNNEVLYAAAYIVGSEAILRMTGGNPVYEFSKYSVVLLMFIGFYYKGISKNAAAYWIFLLLLFPGVFIATYSLKYTNDLQNRVSFNTSGPICLGICSLYCYLRQVTFKQINEILFLIGLPIISTTVYLALFTPSVREVITGTGSNYTTSGGFGPNQVATILGLGMFVFVSRLIYYSHSKVLFLINFIIAFNITYRGLVTFSRGGMMTSFIMVIILILLTYFKINSKARIKMNFALITISTVLIATWLYTSNQTGGLIEKRYANEDARGRVKEDQFTGRGQLAAEEIKTFLEHPIFGVGVGKTAETRQQRTGVFIATHNEITRMLAEHGSLGILCLIILLITPLFLYLDNKHNIYLVCFIVFWILTINHAAMRMAAPAFIYSLSLLKVVINEEKPLVHRE
ncbi:O-antigen ligase family protein [Flavobacterium luteum]|uniref:O-antigen ligase family protein n=1 Tax=Flavobacterium luteum TaxID=2026654 RepID=A0A7J5AG86_9FLAO|nr:O-antigen ligase family protein [Flavobacterium luteum]KAB1156555.1 O-antigen ligase family protein [Flavobacterium luteum]